jgi:DNA-directed RNA polymerase specialized sigma24 family protein
VDSNGFLPFVTDRRPSLLGTALLLTGDRGTAEELVQRALGRVRRAGSTSGPRDPDTVALRAVVAGATSRWARFARSEQVIESLPDPFSDPLARTPDLAAALRGLPPRTRAVVVLRWHEQLPDDRIAVLLRRPVGEVAAAAALGLERLGRLVASGGYERGASDVPVEQRLADALGRLAGTPGVWRLDTATAAVADVSARRTAVRRRTAVAAVALVGVLAVAVPLARWAPDPAPTEAAAAPSSGTEATPPPIAPRGIPVLAGPPRGSLAADAAFLDAVRTTGWGAQDAPPPDQRTVVFAGDTPQGRVALVVGTVLEDFRGVWLTGPVGAPAGDLVPHLPRQLGEGRPLALLVGGPGEASLVVVAAAGDEIAVSDRLMTGPRGTVGRTYDDVPSPDGVAVVPARATSLGPALSVRVTREGRQVYRSAADWLGEPDTTVADLPPTATLRPAPAAADPHVVADALADLALPLGVEPERLQPDVLWSAELTPGRAAASVVVLVAHSPGGALVVTTWAGGAGGAVACGTQTPPGTTDVDTLTVARLCDVATPGLGEDDDGRWLVFSAPADAASAEVLDGRGRVLGPLALTGGGAVVPVPAGARTVRTLDAGGQPLRETPIAPAPTEPFGDFGSGPQR